MVSAPFRERVLFLFALPTLPVVFVNGHESGVMLTGGWSVTLVGPSARCQQRQNLTFTQRTTRSLHPSRRKERDIFFSRIQCNDSYQMWIMYIRYWIKSDNLVFNKKCEEMTRDRIQRVQLERKRENHFNEQRDSRGTRSHRSINTDCVVSRVESRPYHCRRARVLDSSVSISLS